MEAYSESTGTHYPSWEALVEAEANGWVAIAVIDNGKQRWPWVIGPFLLKKDAELARTRLRTKFRKDPEHQNNTAQFFVRPAWKADR